MKHLTNEQLLQNLANATITHYGCHGHTKAEMNEQYCNEYKAEIRNRGLDIPDLDTLLKTGVFNGSGTF